MADTTLARLGGKDSEGRPFLDTHHVAAAERLERLFLRAQMRQRVTMSYDAHVGGGTATNMAGDLSDGAADARAKLTGIARAMPPDCWSLLVDICCLSRGLQEVELERRWPRRSAKLVLRIGLGHLAVLFGLAPHRASGQTGLRGWSSERLPMFGTPDS